MADIIRFVKSSKRYSANIGFPLSNVIRLEFLNTTMPDDSSIECGFYIIIENGTICGKYDDYKYLFKNINDNVIYLTNIEGYTELSLKDNENVSSGDIKDNIDDVKVENSSNGIEIKNTLEKIKSAKISELSQCCNSEIEKGITINEETFSYKTEDQINIKQLYDISISQDSSIIYHSDGNESKEFSKEEVETIYKEEQKNLLKHMNYYNLLKQYILSLTNNDILTIKNITYGDKLQAKYLDKYNEIIAKINELYS